MALTTSGAEEGQGYALTYEIKRISKIAVASMDVVRCQRRYVKKLIEVFFRLKEKDYFQSRVRK